MKICSFFSGIGGLELGLEWGLTQAGVACETVLQAEIEPFRRHVLHNHWPNAVQFADVRDLLHERLPASDIFAAGTPCQDMSLAGDRGGIGATRSGLWSVYEDLIGKHTPTWVVWENVAGALAPTKRQKAGLSVVLRDLDRLDYNATWVTLTAMEYGAKHLRRRVFVLARRRGAPEIQESCPGKDPPDIPWADPADPERQLRVRRAPAYHRDRIEALGNAVAPLCAATIGLWIAGRTRFPEPRMPLPKGVVSWPEYGVLKGGKYSWAPRDYGAVPPDLVPTVTGRDWRSGKASWGTRARNCRPLSEVCAPEGFLNPSWVERHMGFPEGWTLPGEGAPRPKKRG